MVVYQNGVITDLDIKSALKMRKTIDLDLYRVANEISMKGRIAFLSGSKSQNQRFLGV